MNKYISVEGDDDPRRKRLTRIVVTIPEAAKTKQQELRVNGQMKWAASPSLILLVKGGRHKETTAAGKATSRRRGRFARKGNER